LKGRKFGQQDLLWKKSAPTILPKTSRDNRGVCIPKVQKQQQQQQQQQQQPEKTNMTGGEIPTI